MKGIWDLLGIPNTIHEQIPKLKYLPKIMQISNLGGGPTKYIGAIRKHESAETIICERKGYLL